MKHVLCSVTIVLATLAFFPADLLHAQFLRPFHASAGVATATEEARLQLGSDAVLILVGAIGELDAPEMPIRFYPDNGESDAWAYVFFSPSAKQRKTIPVVDVMGMGMMAVDDPTAIAIPDELVTPLNLTLPFADSDTMIERIATDTIYQRYRRELPDVLPQTIACRSLLADDSLLLPATFPLDAPVWVLTYTGEEDSMMLCYISCRTGQTFSLRANSVASVASSGNEQQSIHVSSVVSSTGRIRITLSSAQKDLSTDPPAILLFDITGRCVARPVMAEYRGSEWVVEFDDNVLPHGLYFCRAVGKGWDRTISIVR